MASFLHTWLAVCYDNGIACEKMLNVRGVFLTMLKNIHLTKTADTVALLVEGKQKGEAGQCAGIKLKN